VNNSPGGKFSCVVVVYVVVFVVVVMVLYRVLRHGCGVFFCVNRGCIRCSGSLCGCVVGCCGCGRVVGGVLIPRRKLMLKTGLRDLSYKKSYSM
jgi:hypothetical protein